MRVFVSVPANGRADSEVGAEKAAILDRLHAAHDEPVELVDSFVSEDAPVSGDRAGAWYLGESIKRLATADAAYFADGWDEARGCRIEQLVCERYNIPIFSMPRTGCGWNNDLQGRNNVTQKELSQIAEIRAEIAETAELLARLRSAAEGTTGNPAEAAHTGRRRSGGDKAGAIAGEISECEDALKDANRRFEEAEKAGSEFFASVQNPTLRVALRLRYYWEFSWGEIAALVGGITGNAIKKRCASYLRTHEKCKKSQNGP